MSTEVLEMPVEHDEHADEEHDDMPEDGEQEEAHEVEPQPVPEVDDSAAE